MKILIYGLPKSGTTILKARIQEALKTAGYKDISIVMEPVDREPGFFVNYAGEKIAENENSLTKALMSVDEPFGVDYRKVNDMFSDYDYKIFIMRDPRDRLISQVFYRWFKAPEDMMKDYAATHARIVAKEAAPHSLPFYTLFSTRVKRLNNWKNHWESFAKALVEFRQNADDSWFIYPYEDCVNGEYDALSTFLGLQITDKATQSPGLKRVARTNTSDNWRRWFTEDDVEYFSPLLNPILDAYGYDSNDWTLSPQESLPAAEGSEYVEKLVAKPQSNSSVKSAIKKQFSKLFSK
ncbi:MAG: hypothetical protein SchgKO_19400 [Schleiferiaceae bacterium]